MEILKLGQKNSAKIVWKVIKYIKQGKVIVLPTDTVYGLVADATNKKAVERILKIKNRSKEKAIPIFVKDIKMVGKLAKINKNQEKFLNSVWSGKMTAVLKLKIKNEKLKICGIDRKTIALRIPKYKLILRLLKRTNILLTGTSANISNRPASTKIKEVIEQFGNQKEQPDLIIDAGNLPKSRPSTVIDLTEFPPKVLRY